MQDRNMGKQRVVSKALSPAELIKALQAGTVTFAQAQQMFNGVIPIGNYNGIAAAYDIDKQVIQPLILAEKQWTLDRVDPRNGECHVTIPDGAALNTRRTAEIEVPAGDVWYLCEHEITIMQNAGLLTSGTISVNFRVSSFPKVNGADKLYYDINDPQVYLTKLVGAKVDSEGLIADWDGEIDAGNVYDHRLTWSEWNVAAIAEVKRDFRDGDELNTELRLVGGDTLTLEVVVTEALTPTEGLIDVFLRVWGRVGKLLVS